MKLIIKIFLVGKESGRWTYNQSQKLLRLTIFSWKSPKKMLDLLKDAQKCLSPWFNVVPRLEKLCQAVVAKNNQEKLQPTLNKGAGGTSLTIFVKKMEKGFSKTQNFFFFFFWKIGLYLGEDYIDMFIG